MKKKARKLKEGSKREEAKESKKYEEMEDEPRAGRLQLSQLKRAK